MDGPYLTFQVNVPAVPVFLLNMLWPVQQEALWLSDTMKYAMFLQAFYPRHVTTSLSNQPYNHWPESLSLQSANTDEHARLDVAASGIWGGRFERTFFDVRVFNPYAPSNQTPQIQASYRKHENEKRRKYEQRVVEIEHSTFIPFVLACTGGVGPAATLTLKRVGNLLAEKHNSPYSHVMGFLRSRLSFCPPTFHTDVFERYKIF